MNRQTLRAALVTVCVMWAAAASAQQQWTPEQQELWKLEEQQWQMSKDKDQSWIDKMVHPNLAIWETGDPAPRNRASLERWNKLYELERHGPGTGDVSARDHGDRQRRGRSVLLPGGQGELQEGARDGAGALHGRARSRRVGAGSSSRGPAEKTRRSSAARRGCAAVSGPGASSASAPGQPAVGRVDRCELPAQLETGVGVGLGVLVRMKAERQLPVGRFELLGRVAVGQGRRAESPQGVQRRTVGGRQNACDARRRRARLPRTVGDGSRARPGAPCRRFRRFGPRCCACSGGAPGRGSGGSRAIPAGGPGRHAPHLGRHPG